MFYEGGSVKKFHCLFEQSGTFKNVFKKFGYSAFDYDILNDYGETDFQINLFREIEDAYWLITKYPYVNKVIKDTGNSVQATYNLNIFMQMKPKTDFIIAFFPCTYFSIQNELMFTGKANSGKVFNTTQFGIEKIITRAREREYYYEVFLKFCFICQELKIPTIIENPSHENYLRKNNPFYKGIYFERDRTLFGDKLIKPTMYIPLNFEFKEEFQMFDKEYKKNTPINKQPKGRTRSEITPRYAENFYKRFIKNYIENFKEE